MLCVTQGNECERTDKSAQKKVSLCLTVSQCIRVDHDLDCAPLQRPEVASAPAGSPPPYIPPPTTAHPPDSTNRTADNRSRPPVTRSKADIHLLRWCCHTNPADAWGGRTRWSDDGSLSLVRIWHHSKTYWSLTICSACWRKLQGPTKTKRPDHVSDTSRLTDILYHGQSPKK